MKKIILFVLTLAALALTGCGSDFHDPFIHTTEILSDTRYDGDIARDADTGAFTITQGNTQTVYAGFDPADGAELRAFLHFPLTSVPSDAFIDSATLDINISSIQPNPLSGTIPIRIDLVDLDPPTLITDDFSRSLQPALASTTIYPPISQADFGKHVPVDVTSLMREAQRLNLPRFQVRILRDPGANTPGMIEINDTTGINRSELAPLLEVRYF